MTLELKVTVPEDAVKAGRGEEYLALAMAAIGFRRGVSLQMPEFTKEALEALHDDKTDALRDNVATAMASTVAHETASTATPPTPEQIDEGLYTPERGFLKSEEGRARRLKAQIEEDEALAAKLTEKGLNPADYEGKPLSAVQDALANGLQEDAPANISSGEERIDPTTAEDAAQDKADEAAEVAQTQNGLTLDDLRQAVGDFQKVHGMAAMVEQIPALLGCAVGEVKDEDLEEAIAKVKAATAGETKMPASAKEEPSTLTATRDDVIEAMLDYAEKYDGKRSGKPDEVPNLAADIPGILEPRLGAGVTGLSKVPATPEGYGKAVAAIKEAIETNPFKREVKG